MKYAASLTATEFFRHIDARILSIRNGGPINVEILITAVPGLLDHISWQRCRGGRIYRSSFSTIYPAGLETMCPAGWS